jgi:hypothetical protein
MWEMLGAVAVVLILGAAWLSMAHRHFTTAFLARNASVPTAPEAAPVAASAAAPLLSPEQRDQVLERLDLVLERLEDRDLPAREHQVLERLHREVVELRAVIERNGR